MWHFVIELVEAQSDITLEEIIDELELPIRKSRLSLLLIKEGYSFKKRQSTQRLKTEKT